MSNDLIKHITDASFVADVHEADKPVLVDYWAEWCSPCHAIAPVLDDLATVYADRLQVVKLNIDQNPATPAQMGIRGIPTLMLFKDGKQVATQVGAVSKAQLITFIDRHL